MDWLCLLKITMFSGVKMEYGAASARTVLVLVLQGIHKKKYLRRLGSLQKIIRVRSLSIAVITGVFVLNIVMGMIQKEMVNIIYFF